MNTAKGAKYTWTATFIFIPAVLIALLCIPSHAVSIANLDPNVKAQICSNSTNVCSTSCGSTPTVNTCDTNTLQWNCTCADNGIGSLAAYDFPVPYTMCLMDMQNCLAHCANVPSAGNERSLCRQQCFDSYSCGTVKASTNYTEGGAASQGSDGNELKSQDAAAAAAQLGITKSAGAMTVDSQSLLLELLVAVILCNVGIVLL